MKLKDFTAALAGGAGDRPALLALAKDVRVFVRQFPAIGYDSDAMRYKD